MSSEIKQQPDKINIGRWLSSAWETLNQDFGMFMLLGLIYTALVIISSGTVIGTIVIMGPINVGMFYAILKKLRGEELQIGEIGQGFAFFGAAILAHLLIMFFTAIGLFLLIFPGIIVFVFYMFTPLFIADQNMDFWQAMEASRNLVKGNLFDMLVFGLALTVIMLAGFLLLGIGLIFTTPLCFLAIAKAYTELVN